MDTRREPEVTNATEKRTSQKEQTCREKTKMSKMWKNTLERERQNRYQDKMAIMMESGKMHITVCTHMHVEKRLKGKMWKASLNGGIDLLFYPLPHQIN